jgi:outer membrane cobalamin receptor
MKRMFLVLTAVVFSSKLLAQLAPAPQQDSALGKQLDEVVVTATRFQQKQSTTGKVVAVIDQATLQRNVGKTLVEVINAQAGVFINGANNNLGTNQDVYFRGAGSGNTLTQTLRPLTPACAGAASAPLSRCRRSARAATTSSSPR